MNWKFWRHKQVTVNVGLVDVTVQFRDGRRETITYSGECYGTFGDSPVFTDAVDVAHDVIEKWGMRGLVNANGVYYPMDLVQKIRVGKMTSLRRVVS
jgi:hypothetical protein